MTSRRLFPRALLSAAAAVLLASAAAPADAAQNPTWFEAATIPQTVGHPAFAPQVAASHGRVLTIWKETAGGRDRLLTSVLTPPSTAWTTPEVLTDMPTGSINETPRPVADRDGNISVLWMQNDGSAWALKANTLLVGDSSWSGTTTLSGDVDGSLLPPEGISDYRLVPRPDGAMVAAWASYHGGPDTIRFLTRAARSAAWDPTPVDIDQDGSSPSRVSVQFNASGDGIAVWTAMVGSDAFMRFSRYHAAENRWDSGADAFPITDASTRPQVALGPLGNATVLWDGNGSPLLSGSLPAGSQAWTADADPLTPAGHSTYTAAVASDRSGNMVAVYQDYADSDLYGTSRAVTRVRDPQTGSWSPAENLMGEQFGGAIDFAVDRNYNMVATMLTATALPNVRVAAVYRPDGATSFTDNESLRATGTDFSSGLPSPALDDLGNPVAVWPQIGDSDVTVGYAIGDANGPAINDLTVPSSGTVGEDLTFSVNPFDTLSGVDGTSWSFGDGSDAAGSTVTRRYTTAGTYTVTVSASDLSGLVTTTTREITIADAPADETETTEEKEKVTLAPVIEARLKGKTITLATRVTLRAGKRCSGKVSATTRFGTKTYRTTLKLSKVGTTCVGTGTIKLKKTPGARTKLRVTVSSKSIRTRTVTTKRA